MCYLNDVPRLRIRQVHVNIVANRQRRGDVICTGLCSSTPFDSCGDGIMVDLCT